LSVYLDASVVVPLFVDEDSTDRMIAWLAGGGPVTLSDWTVAEVSSAMSHHVRRERLDPDERDAAETHLNTWLDLSVTPQGVDPEDVVNARALLHRHPNLRTPDALHLAIVHRLGVDLATYDQDLAEAAIRDGVVVVAP
jgi:uncharacterized protein